MPEQLASARSSRICLAARSRERAALRCQHVTRGPHTPLTPATKRLCLVPMPAYPGVAGAGGPIPRRSVLRWLRAAQSGARNHRVFCEGAKRWRPTCDGSGTLCATDAAETLRIPEVLLALCGADGGRWRLHVNRQAFEWKREGGGVCLS